MPLILFRWLVTTLAILVVPHLVPGVSVEGFGTAPAAAAILGVLNALVRPALVFLTLPLTVLTLGLFILVINALLFEFAGYVVSGLHIETFWSALFGSLIVSLVSWVMNAALLPGTGGARVVVRRPGRGRASGDSSRGRTVDLRKDSDGHWE
jgi:putative membrane protein